MPTSVSHTNAPSPLPPQRSGEEAARAAAERARQAEALAAQTAKATRAHNYGVGTVVDITS